MTPLLSWTLQQYLRWHARRTLASMQRPRDAQNEAFTRLRRLLARSDLAVSTGFEGCRRLEDCRSLSVSDSESIKPHLEKVFQAGAASGHIFGRSKLWGFARTSGSRGEPKNVPMNAAYFASLDRTLLRMVATHLHTGGGWDTLLSGKRVLLGSRPRCGAAPCGLPVADISGLIPTRTWWSIRWLYAPRHQDLWIDDWSGKVERILDQIHGKAVVAISGIPALAMDFARRAKERYGVRHLDAVWPHLRQYVYGAVHLSAAQREELHRSWFAGPVPLNIFETYFSTEAPLAFSYEPNQDGLALNSLENLFLFQPYSGDRSLLFADELQEGGEYSIHITTPGGLVNYRMGDRIQVVSARPLLIRVLGREGEELSLTGEKITLHQVDLALEAAGLGPRTLGSLLPAVWAEGGERPHLVWALPQTPRAVEASARWAHELDAALCRLNVLYDEALRLERVIGPSKIEVLPRAVFERYQGSNLGVGQFKAKRLFSSRAQFSQLYRADPLPLEPEGGGGAEA